MEPEMNGQPPQPGEQVTVDQLLSIIGRQTVEIQLRDARIVYLSEQLAAAHEPSVVIAPPGEDED